MNFIVQPPKSKVYTAILVVVDRFTKMAHFIPTTDNVIVSDTLDLFLSQVFAYHGLPNDIVSNRGSVFISTIMQPAMEALGITQNLSTAYRPPTDRRIDRTHECHPRVIPPLLYKLPARRLEQPFTDGRTLLQQLSTSNNETVSVLCPPRLPLTFQRECPLSRTQ